MARTPEELHQAWAQRFSAGDADGLMDLYEDDALLVPQPGAEPVRGEDGVRQVLDGFLATEATFELRGTRALESSGIAVIYSKWTLKGGKGTDGQPLDLAGETTDVARRQPDGEWKFVLDNPWGVGL